MMAKKKRELDAYEQEIEDNLEFTKSVVNKAKRIEAVVEAAKEHIKNKNSLPQKPFS
jgi:hypothetical protein